MTAKVKPSPNGGSGWIAHCPEHSAAMAGTMSEADEWADVHNETEHDL